MATQLRNDRASMHLVRDRDSEGRFPQPGTSMRARGFWLLRAVIAYAIVLAMLCVGWSGLLATMYQSFTAPLY